MKLTNGKMCGGLLVQVFGAEQNWLPMEHLGSHLGLHRAPSPEKPSGHGPHASAGDCDVSGDSDELFLSTHSTPGKHFMDSGQETRSETERKIFFLIILEKLEA